MLAKSSQPELEKLRTLLATPELPELGPGPRTSVLPVETLTRKLEDCLASSDLPSPAHLPIRALVLLWHDHLDSAHSIAQDLPGSDGSFLHGIMHRREPDYGNAKYWFHRVGSHECFPELARKATALLQSKKENALRERLVAGIQWDPFAFIDACEKAATRPKSDPQTELLRAIQGIELELLLGRFCLISS